MLFRAVKGPGRAASSALVLFSLVCVSAVHGADLMAMPACDVLHAIMRPYESVTNVVTTVSRSYTAGKGADWDIPERVSRVIWARGRRMNVECLKPVEFKTILDGTNVYYKARKGKVETHALEAQSAAHFAQAISPPASPIEILSAFKKDYATDIPMAEGERIRRIVLFPAFSTNDAARAVLAFDATGRIRNLCMYEDEDRTLVSDIIEFSSPIQPLPGVWLYRKQEHIRASRVGGGSELTVFENLQLNTELPEHVFDPKSLK